MSWDVVLFNSKQKIEAVEDVDETQLVDIDFDDAFQKHFENIKIRGNAATVDGKDYSLVYYLGEPASTTIVNLYGEYALYALVVLAKKHNWQIFDTGSGQMIDLENPAVNGYENFQAYLKHVLSTYRE